MLGAINFAATWNDLVRNADSFPSTSTAIGLGRSFAWNQWARVNDVVGAEFHVRRDRRDVFLAMAASLRNAGNALDARDTSTAVSVPAAASVQLSHRSSAAELD